MRRSLSTDSDVNCDIDHLVLFVELDVLADIASGGWKATFGFRRTHSPNATDIAISTRC